MSGRKVVPIAILVVLLLVGGLVAMLMQSPGGVGDGDDSDAQPVNVTKDDDKARRKKQPAVPKRRWREEGSGQVIGIVKEYGSDKPLANVDVSLEAGLPGPDTVIRTTTNSDGSFVIDDALNFDEWLLRVTPSAPMAERQMNGIEVIADKATNVGVIYVTPTYVVPGIVVDEQGDPIHGATVRVLRQRPAGAGMDFLRLIRELPAPPAAAETALTDIEGKFELLKIPPGNYDIEVSAEQYTQRTERGIPISPSLSERPLRFVLVRGFELEGRVVRPSGGNVAGLSVVAFSEPNNQLEMFQVDRRYAVTDESGGFRLTGLAAGEMIVAVTPEGEPFTVKDDVTVPGTEFIELVIQGDSWITGKVTNEDDQPIEDAEIFIAIFDQGSPIVGNTRTDASGQYRIDGLRAGPLQLFMVRADGYGSHPEDPVAIMRGNGGGESLKHGENVRDISLGKGAIVRGTVIDQSTDQPIEGATVRLVSVRSFFGGEQSGISGTDGTFEIVSVPKGQAMMSVSKEGYYQPGVNQMSIGMMFQGAMGGQSAPEDPGKGAMVSITEAGQIIEREIKMAAGSVIKGVVQTPDGEPVPGARITLEADQGQGMMRMLSSVMSQMDPRLSQDGGRFQIPGPSPGSQARVVAKAQGWLDGRTDPISLGPGEVMEDLVVTLRRGAVIEGVVKGGDGRPLTGAFVRWAVSEEGANEWIKRRELRQATPSVTGEDGRFHLENVEPGKVIVQADHAEHTATTEASIEVSESKATSLDFKLAAGGVLTGTAMGPDGRPHSGTRIDVTYRGEGNPYRYARAPDDIVVGEDGSFEIKGLAPGPYDLIAQGEGVAPSPTVRVDTGTATPVALKLEPAFVIAGTVRFEEGGIASSVQVQLFRINEDAEQSVGNARSDTNGDFTFENQPAGTYSVRTGGWSWGGETTQVLPTRVDDVQAGQENVMLTVSRGLSIAGTVVAPGGSVPEMGWVSVNRIRQEGEDASANVSTGGQMVEGRFEIGGLSPGSYTVNINIGSQSRSVRADAGTNDLRVEFDAGGTVRGRVTLPDGSPAVGANVSATGARVTADSDGNYALKGVSAGVVTVQAGHWVDGKAHQGRVENVEVRDRDEVAGIDIALELQQTNR